MKRVQAGWPWIPNPGRGKRFVLKTSSWWVAYPSFCPMGTGRGVKQLGAWYLPPSAEVKNMWSHTYTICHHGPVTKWGFTLTKHFNYSLLCSYVNWIIMLKFSALFLIYSVITWSLFSIVNPQTDVILLTGSCILDELQ